MKEVFLAWQDTREQSRRWYPIGRLSFDGKKYSFSYTKGVEDAKSAGFELIEPFLDVHGVYIDEKLFPLFTNRLISPARKDFSQFVSWLNLPQDKQEPLVILGRSGGAKSTDTFQMFANPEKDEQGKYSLSFFVHGMRHISGAIESLSDLRAGEVLELVPDSGNEHDQWAVKVASKNQLLGYCPRFINHDLQRLIASNDTNVIAHVERINESSAPIQYRVLCTVHANWPQEFEPFSDPEYASIGTHVATVSANPVLQEKL